MGRTRSHDERVSRNDVRATAFRGKVAAAFHRAGMGIQQARIVASNVTFGTLKYYARRYEGKSQITKKDVLEMMQEAQRHMRQAHAEAKAAIQRMERPRTATQPKIMPASQRGDTPVRVPRTGAPMGSPNRGRPRRRSRHP